MSKETQYKITKEQFNYFKARCKYWAEKLGQVNWEYLFFLEKLDNQLASTIYNSDARWANIYLLSVWEERKPTKNEIDLVAFHEIFELLMSEFRFYLANNNISEDKISEMTHKVIVTVQNAFVDHSLRGK